MSYDVGEYIDLSYLNKTVEKKTEEQTEDKPTLYDIGTALSFQTTPQGFKTALHIPVAFA